MGRSQGVNNTTRAAQRHGAVLGGSPQRPLGGQETGETPVFPPGKSFL